MMKNLSTRLLKRFKRFARSQTGNISAVVAASAVPLMLAGGAAVDYGNWVSVQARLQAAVDAAALAAAREINREDDELVRIGTQYFASNFGQPRNSGIPEVVMTVGDGKIRVDAKVDVDNYLMKIVGQEKQTIATYAEATLHAQKLHVVFSFDNTGSMASQQRLSTLKVAATDFVEILFDGQQEAPSHSELMVGVVPFSQFVNVGPEKFGDSSVTWLDHDGINPLSRMNFADYGAPTGGPYHNKEAWDQVIRKRRQLSWPGCVEARKGELAVQDVFDGSAAQLFPYAFAPDEPGKVSENQACFDKYGIRTNCGNADKWVYYNNYLDDTLDEAPGSGSDVDRLNWLQNHNRKYFRNRVSTKDQGNERGPDKGCNVAAIQPLTNKKAPVLATIDAMVADGYTHIAEGVAWAQRVLSPEAPFQESEGSADDVTKVMILLSDGGNTFETRKKNHNLSTYTAYGYLKQANQRLETNIAFGDGEISAQVDPGQLTIAAINMQNELTLAACQNAKDAGTIIYTFAYHVSDTSLLEKCASSGTTKMGNGPYFFKATSNLQLMKDFEYLANELRPPYLSQ